MLLNDLLKAADVLESAGDCSANVSSLEFDSRRVTPGALFFATRGTQTDGHAFIEAAVGAGAVAVVCETMPARLAEGVAYLRVADSSVALGRMASAFYGDPSRSLRLVGVTGTNGKTTTTALCGEIMANYYRDVKVVGNIGIPYTSVAADTTDETVTVAEISSFQLETIHTFHPAVSAILNITPDHLNRHHTMECYIKTKERIAENQTEDEVCVLNYEDEVLRAFGETLHTNVLYFSSSQKLDRGLYLDGEDIYYADGENTTKVINVNELNILGMHNYENVMAATGIALSLGVPMDKIVEVLKRFQAVEHRIEYVTEKRGVKFYNDSKGTNPDAAIKGICAMNRPTLLIGGGYDKQSEYDEWIESFGGKVKLLVLIGQTREKIAACARAHGFENIVLCDTFEEAIDTCYRNAVSGDAVLLSPACASWGMFKNYEERGRIFKEYVRALKED